MRFRTFAILVAALWAAQSAAASVASTTSTALATAEIAPPAHLIAPNAAIPMVAGETAELEWGPLASFLDLPNVSEWEAFLSLDDGATYPIRITPHLDRDLRRISWQVPEFPSRSARLLLRFGDERRETSVEMPHRFVILQPVGGAASVTLYRNLTSTVHRLGESARPGEPGVVMWVEGSRHGGDLRRVETDLPETTGRLHSPFALESVVETAEEPPRPNAKSRIERAAMTEAFLSSLPRTNRLVAVRAPIFPIPPLLQTLRSNR